MSKERHHPGVKVTVKDLKTEERYVRIIWDDYVLICAGKCYVANNQVYPNGTNIITVKKSKS